MAAFLYRAVDPSGRTAKGVVEAPSAAAARHDLRARKLLPIAVEPARDGTRSIASFRGPGLPQRTVALVTRQMATLIGGGVRVEEALKTVADQLSSARGRSLLLDLRAAILDGRGFGDALGDHPGSFGDYYVASVKAGEASGKLDHVMAHLADHVETRARNRQKVQLALLYPALLALVSLGVIVALLTYVVPDIVRVFTARGAELPMLTRILIGLSEFLEAWGLVLLAILSLSGIAAVWLLRKPSIRLRFHRVLTRFPLTRALVLKSNAAQFSGTLATLIVSRVPLTEALAAAAETVPNVHIRTKVQTAAARVREGGALSRALKDTGVFPPLLLAMIASGEAGGDLGNSLTRAAMDQTRDLDAIVAALVSLVEPAVLLLMGGIVMLLVMSILLPIVDLNSLAQ